MVHLFELCEIAMLLCFGFSWPLSAIKSYRADDEGQEPAVSGADFAWLRCGHYQ